VLRRVAGAIGAVGFDAGEFLVDETREYGTWTDRLGVPRHVFSAVFRAVIARGQDYRETFQVFQPGFDLDKADQQRANEGKPERFGEEDLYPDVQPAPARLRDDGLRVGMAGNQTAPRGWHPARPRLARRHDCLNRLVDGELRIGIQGSPKAAQRRQRARGGHTSGGKHRDTASLTRVV
jgi:hypothetical protein